MGPLLARASLLVKDLGFDPDVEPCKLIRVGAVFATLIVVGEYLAAGHFLVWL
ncbi:hypothetical protein QQ056_14780 [Oscillatoria laete-virens NRMC-F 0139]|nr:hypothetical protein [Oscillatoria laete-virens]MDL5054802.1 hypothetical protein [Oscillatoria laete-virens NRMC-F 0139]